MKTSWLVKHGWYIKKVDDKNRTVTLIGRDFREINFSIDDVLFDANKVFTLKERYEIIKFLSEYTLFFGEYDVKFCLKKLMLAFIKEASGVYDKFGIDFDEGLVTVQDTTFDFVNGTWSGEVCNVVNLFMEYVGEDIYGEKLAN